MTPSVSSSNAKVCFLRHSEGWAIRRGPADELVSATCAKTAAATTHGPISHSEGAGSRYSDGQTRVQAPFAVTASASRLHSMVSRVLAADPSLLDCLDWQYLGVG